jgi:glutaryl-CoA dehydrogenase
MAKATFSWDDALLLEDQLGEEERLVRDTARAYCQDKLQPRVIAAFREEEFDREILSEMGELGMLGSTLPEEHGGAGLSHVAYGLIAREVERVDSRRRTIWSAASRPSGSATPTPTSCPTRRFGRRTTG